MSAEQRARLKAQRDAETDPVQREAYAMAARAGFDWYDTESMARRAFEHAAAELVPLRESLAFTVRRMGEFFGFYGYDDDENLKAYRKAEALVREVSK
jgi:hypothetical protein